VPKSPKLEKRILDNRHYLIYTLRPVKNFDSAWFEFSELVFKPVSDRYNEAKYIKLLSYTNGKGKVVRHSKLQIAILLLSFFFLTGCFSSNPKDIEAFKKPYEVDVTMDKYILQPADEIQVISPTVPDMHQVSRESGPTARYLFPNIGEIAVAGKTQKEVADLLREQAAKLYTLSGTIP